MKIQSISIVVPTSTCINNCKFCVSRMHGNPYEKHFDELQIKKRIKFALSEKVNTCVITGTGEAFQNKRFLVQLSNLFQEMNHPFSRVELQTTGVMLNDGTDENIRLLKSLGVDTISLSISDLYSSDNNLKIMGVPEKLKFNLEDLCKFIKDQGFNLRLSLNMTNIYDNEPIKILIACKKLGADQITFRKLYYSNDDSPQTRWVKENSCDEILFSNISDIIKFEGKPRYKLPFGSIVYSINGMSVVIDNNCMNDNVDVENLKYVILRENGKLYSHWDDEGSLIF